MKNRSKTIGSFNAKTHLAHMLAEVQDGVDFIITKRGKPVAKLIKHTDVKDYIKLTDIICEFDEIRNSVKGKVNINRYINEGRKH
ncbi:MAG: type II toxin-antitoxin system prevent-host-death family antitoxin [Spirochaetota bacterium]